MSLLLLVPPQHLHHPFKLQELVCCNFRGAKAGLHSHKRCEHNHYEDANKEITVQVKTLCREPDASSAVN